VRGDPDVIFSYACPVAELQWIDEWQFDLLHSDSGRNELHNIFAEPFSSAMVLRLLGQDTVWYTTRWDTAQRQFHSVLLTGDLVVAQWEFHLHALDDRQDRGDRQDRRDRQDPGDRLNPDDRRDRQDPGTRRDRQDRQDGRCRLEVTLTSTGLSPEGDRIVAEPDYAQRMRSMLSFVLRSAKCYAETGQILRMPHHRKAGLALSLLGTTLGRHLRRLHRPSSLRRQQRQRRPDNVGSQDCASSPHACC
jgi:hypothetical protein